MTQLHSNEVFLDSEASLRLVDRALTELGVSRSDEGGESTPEVASTGSPTVAELMSLLPGVHAEIRGVIRGVRESRGVLQRAGFDRLHHDVDRSAVTFAAPAAATAEMLAHLDRALGMVDALEATDDGTVRRRLAATIRSGLRDELLRAIDRLRLQDFTSRQLHSASVTLEEMEERLSLVARIFDPERLGPE